MKLVILFNPSSGRGRARRALGKAVAVLRRHGVDPRIYESRSAQHLIELAREAREERPDVVVSAGGDGTLHYVLNGLVGSQIPLGLLPLGSGNDFAQGVGVPADPRGAAEILMSGHVQEVDVARVGRAGREGSAVYACIGGAGFDSAVTRYANERVRRMHGRSAYAWAILQCARSFRPQSLELRSDVQSYSGEVMFVAVGNNVSYGGGLRMTPHASLNDGLLDVCIVPAMGKLELLRWVPRVYRGTHLAHPRIIYFRARRVELNSPSRMELFGDGEFLQELPAEIQVIPRALRVLVPRGKETEVCAALSPSNKMVKKSFFTLSEASPSALERNSLDPSLRSG